ncbi:MAG: HAD family hydrolase, partial [Methylococcales bacterium]
VSQGKPAPDIFLATAQALLTPIAQCLVLEDSAIGIQAAVDAGAISVLVPSIQPVHTGAAYMADYIYTDLDQVAEIIKYCRPPAV